MSGLPIFHVCPLKCTSMSLLKSFYHQIYLSDLPVRFIDTNLSHQYLTNVQSWNKLFGCKTMHPTQKFISMNVLQMLGIIIWELPGCGGCYRPKKMISWCTLWHIYSTFSASSAYQRFTKKFCQL